MAKDALRITSGTAAGGSIEIEDELLFGRDAGGPGTLGGDPSLSRRHAQIRRGADGGLVIEDLGSSNGTLVNGQAVTGPTPLRPGDRIEMGGTIIEVPSAPGATTVSQRPDPGATSVSQRPDPGATSVSQRPDPGATRQVDRPATPPIPPSRPGPPPRQVQPVAPVQPAATAAPSGGGRGLPKALIPVFVIVGVAIGIGIGAALFDGGGTEADGELTSAPAATPDGSLASKGTVTAIKSGGLTHGSLLAQGFSDETLDPKSGQREVRITMRTWRAPFGIQTLHLHKYLDETKPPPQRTYDGIYTFTTKDGDSISFRANGLVQLPMGPDKQLAQTFEDLEVVSGTGVFAGARGTGTVTTAVAVGVRGPASEPTGSLVNKFIDFTLKLKGDAGTAPAAPALDGEIGGWKLAEATAKNLDAAQRAVGRYLNPDNAGRDGYVPEMENGGEVCTNLGGKGPGAIAFVNQSLVDDGKLDLAKPEALLYMPSEPGRALIGVQYRTAEGQSGTVFGKQVNGALNVWVNLFNPAGLFAPANERSTCALGPAKEIVVTEQQLPPPGGTPPGDGGPPPGQVDGMSG